MIMVDFMRLMTIRGSFKKGSKEAAALSLAMILREMLALCNTGLSKEIQLMPKPFRLALNVPHQHFN